MSSNSIRIVYAQGKTLCIQDTISGAVLFALGVEPWKDYEPLMLQTRDMILHWDKNLFHAYNNGELPEAELIERTRCRGMYRNWLEVATDGDPIEPESLWKLTEDGYILINEDLYHCEPPDAEGFESVIE